LLSESSTILRVDEDTGLLSAFGMDDGQRRNSLGSLLGGAHVVESDSWLMTNRRITFPGISSLET